MPWPPTLQSLPTTLCGPSHPHHSPSCPWCDHGRPHCSGHHHQGQRTTALLGSCPGSVNPWPPSPTLSGLWLGHTPLTTGHSSTTHQSGHSFRCWRIIALLILVLAQPIHNCHRRLTGLGVLLWFPVRVWFVHAPLTLSIADLGCTCCNPTPPMALLRHPCTHHHHGGPGCPSCWAGHTTSPPASPTKPQTSRPSASRSGGSPVEAEATTPFWVLVPQFLAHTYVPHGLSVYVCDQLLWITITVWHMLSYYAEVLIHILKNLRFAE